MLPIKQSGNLSFSSKINIVNFRQMLETTNRFEDGVHVKWSPAIDGTLEYSEGEKIHTAGIGSCTAYGVVKPKEYCALGHYNQYPQVELKSAIKGLKERSEGNGRGFISGGFISSMSEFYEEGTKLYKNIPTTVLWGRPSWIEDGAVCHDVEKDIWHVMPGREQRPIKTAEDLKNVFDVIHIAKGDELIIDGKQIDAVDVNQNDEDLIALGM